MIYDKKYDKFFFIWRTIWLSGGILYVIYFFSVVNPRRWRESDEEFNNNKAYTIGIYVGPSPLGKHHNPCYDFYYGGVKYNAEVGYFTISSEAEVKQITDIRNHYFGDRFIVAVDTLAPPYSQILTDLLVPDDIQIAPERGWKEMPNWDDERAKGNTGALWDRSKVQRPVLEGDPRELYLGYGFAVYCLIWAIREVISFLEDLPGMLRRSPSYIKNELPKVLLGYVRRFLKELEETVKDIKEMIINLPSTLKKFWYGDK